MKPNRKPSEKKVNAVKEIKDLALKYKVIGLLNLENLPNLQFKKIKHKLKEYLLIKTYKKRIALIALSELKDKKANIEKLNEHVKGITALVFTNEDPFKLQKFFSKSKTNAPAKAGQIAPRDLIINPGPTPFTPGPIIGELGQLGIKTEVKEGKVAIKEEKLLVKQDQVIDKKAADLLAKLNMQPMEIGLSLVAAYDNGLIYLKDVLSVNEGEYLKNLKQAYMNSLNLGISISYTNKETISFLLRKASREISALSKRVDINEKEEQT